MKIGYYHSQELKGFKEYFEMYLKIIFIVVIILLTMVGMMIQSTC